MRKKVGILPIFAYESAISTFINKKMYEIIPFELEDLYESEQLMKKIYDEWCFPLKQSVSLSLYGFIHKKLDIVVSVFLNICKYPLAMGDMSKWIKEDVSYLPVEFSYPTASFSLLVEIYDQFSKCFEKYNFISFLMKLPLAYYRYVIAIKLYESYLQNLSLVANPTHFKQKFRDMRREFIQADTYSQTIKIKNKYANDIKKILKPNTPFAKVLLTGDFSVIALSEFSLLEFDTYLAKNKIQMVKPSFPVNIISYKISNCYKKAKKLYLDYIENKFNKAKTDKEHMLELLTLYHINKGIEEGIDGIIYLKPVMCAPCDNISQILKANNFFGLNFLEISYDEHSGLNGILTRLEAFINILAESKTNQKL
jgi:hypothetical protein